MSDPYVSVIIPARDRAHCILDAIFSIKIQTLWDQNYPYEIIVVDDGSTDGTRDLLRCYQKQYGLPLRVSYLDGQGAGAARNRGVREARGEYIAFLDSDDLWHPEKLEKQFSLLKKFEPQEKNVFCFTNYTVRLKSGESFIIDREEYDDTSLIKRIFFGHNWYAFGSSLLAHRSALEKTGGYLEGLRCGEDAEHVFRHISGGGKIAVVFESLVYYACEENKKYPDRDLYRSAALEYLPYIKENFPEDVIAFSERYGGNPHSPHAPNSSPIPQRPAPRRGQHPPLNKTQ